MPIYHGDAPIRSNASMTTSILLEAEHKLLFITVQSKVRNNIVCFLSVPLSSLIFCLGLKGLLQKRGMG
ncbi:hypothetical protein Scep_021304 [Stephania cephalantha]|uniref:Uncharacterized protein n=1 Tax=Stephania cephalantha TaxID=152367 RepID=A0AAP0I1E0_9MAGN